MQLHQPAAREQGDAEISDEFPRGDARAEQAEKNRIHWAFLYEIKRGGIVSHERGALSPIPSPPCRGRGERTPSLDFFFPSTACGRRPGSGFFSMKPAEAPQSSSIARDLMWILGLGLLLIAAGLGLRDPWPADEPRFAVIARDMVLSGNWLFPQVGGDLYADKPPMFMWLIAAGYKFTGSLRLAFLLPSLLASLGTLALVYDLGRRLWNREAGRWAALALLFAVQFTLQAKRAQIDMVLVFLTTLS